MKPGLQHYMGLDARNPDFVACKQQSQRAACASAQSHQRLCYSLYFVSLEGQISLILHFWWVLTATPLLYNSR